ncbi:MAG: hypothetical protein U1D55_14430 [Phycisphaerae bacterium]
MRYPSQNMSTSAAKMLATATLLAAILAATPACSSSGMGAELSATPTARALPANAARPLRLPADEKFSIVFSPSQRAPGLDGEAEASAIASDSGNAEARARVARSGSASGTFQLGHVVKNESASQIDLNCHIHAKYAYDAKSAPATGKRDASVALRLFARDQRNRQLRAIDLLVHGTDQGDASSEVEKDLRITLTLSPGDAASVFLAGSAEANTTMAQSASASLNLSGLKMEFESHPAPPTSAPAGGNK